MADSGGHGARGAWLRHGNSCKVTSGRNENQAISAAELGLILWHGCCSSNSPGFYQLSISPQPKPPASIPQFHPDFSEPVVLASKDGVLEVRLTEHQGPAHSPHRGRSPSRDALLFSYELIKGTASNGQTSGSDQYPAPTLQVFPGETLIVHLDNALTNLTIGDFFDPKYIAKGEEVPLYPEQMTSSPINLHTHGLHVSPKGNSDNVLLHIPGGMSNTYTYKIPIDHPQGAYWYHSHLHGLTSPHTYYGLAGLLAIGRTDGNIPVVTEKHIPIRNMVLQFNYVFDREGGLAQLNNPSWPQWVSTLKPPEGDELAKGTYRPLLAPVNFLQSKQGTQFLTVWYTGPLSINNFRGLLNFIPSNLQRFTAGPEGSGKDVPADPSLPDYQRDVQFTVNGQFQPVSKAKRGRRRSGCSRMSATWPTSTCSSRRQQRGNIRRSPSSAVTEIQAPFAIRLPTMARDCSFHPPAASQSR